MAFVCYDVFRSFPLQEALPQKSTNAAECLRSRIEAHLSLKNFL